MQSWWMQMTETGTALELREVAVPEPGPGQLLVRMHAAALNRGEFVVGHGLHGKAGSWKPIGGEGAGVVAAVGTGVSGFAPGDRVMGRCAGGFSEFALMDAVEAMAVPSGLGMEAASAVPLVFLVTFDMLVLQGRLQPGEWMLVNGVSSGVGVASLQLGKALGARVIGTSGSAAKLQRLKALGLDMGIASRAPDFAPQVMEATGQHGADLVINTQGGSVFAEDIRCMAFEGRLATVGYVDGHLEAPLDIGALHAKRLVVFGVSNKLRNAAQRAAALPRFRQEVLPLIASGRIQPLVDQVYPFARLPAAKEAMESAAHVGKLVLRMDPVH